MWMGVPSFTIKLTQIPVNHQILFRNIALFKDVLTLSDVQSILVPTGMNLGN